MTADYGKKLIDQLDDALAAIESLKEGQRSLNEEIRSLKRENKSALAARDAQHRKEIKLINSLHEKKLAAGNARIAVLEAENTKLKAQINKNSSNSGKPPSSNGFKSIPNSREKTGKKPGGQKGHKGHIPILFEHPDEVADLNRTTCGCGGRIKYESPQAIKQLVDIEVVLHVKEFRAGVGYCADCGKKIENSFPSGITNTVNIGNGIKAMSAMLLHEGAVSVSRTKQFLSGITGGALNVSCKRSN
jgi:hypothetical protein